LPSFTPTCSALRTAAPASRSTLKAARRPVSGMSSLAMVFGIGSSELSGTRSVQSDGCVPTRNRSLRSSNRFSSMRYLGSSGDTMRLAAAMSLARNALPTSAAPQQRPKVKTPPKHERSPPLAQHSSSWKPSPSFTSPPQQSLRGSIAKSSSERRVTIAKSHRDAMMPVSLKSTTVLPAPVSRTVPCR